MADDFVEQIVSDENGGARNVLYYGLRGISVVLAIFALFSLASILDLSGEGSFLNISALIGTLVGAGLFLLAWRGANRARLEYDYTFTNGVLEVAAVFNGAKRKALTSVRTADMQSAGSVNDPACRKILRTPGVQKHRWYLHENAPHYYFYFAKKGEKHAVLLELNEEMRRVIFQKKYFQPGILTGDFYKP